MTNPNIIIGLGNIGSKFDNTRHNVGFSVVDFLNTKKEAWLSGEHQLYCLNWNLHGILIKPNTGMNSSGLSAKDSLQMIKGDISRVIVIYDDMDFDCGIVRIKVGGSSGRHNGIQSVINNIGENFTRVRVGIGKPDKKENGAKFVLSKFLDKEKKLMSNSIQLAANATAYIIQNGIQKAMAKYNRK